MEGQNHGILLLCGREFSNLVTIFHIELENVSDFTRANVLLLKGDKTFQFYSLTNMSLM